MLSQLTVGEMMTRYPVTIGHDQSIDEAARVTLSRKIGRLPVMQNDELVGIITASDIFRVLGRDFRADDLPGRNHVSDWMSTEPITIGLATKMADAHRLMLDRHIRRLPVVERDQVVGMLTLGDIRGALPSNVNPPSAFELNYLCATLTVDRTMTHGPLSVASTATLAEAAKLMLDRKIGGLPVLERDKLVGVLSEADIFRALLHRRESVPTSRRTAFVP